MPELPEVETIVRDLRSDILHKAIRDVWLNAALPKPIATVGVEDNTILDIGTGLRGQSITNIIRRGKLIIMSIANGYSILVHLKMTGQLIVNQAQKTKHTHIVVEFEDGMTLSYNDVRRFGYWVLTDAGTVQNIVHSKAKFGPEPLDDNFTAAGLARSLTVRKAPIKSVLLDQSVVAGLGNIYVDEILHRAGIHPLRRAHSLAPHEVVAVYKAIKQVLQQAVRLGGSSSKNYVRSNGQKGNFRKKHAVYRKMGQACVTCGTRIVRIVIGGRSTHLCPQCQPLGLDSE